MNNPAKKNERFDYSKKFMVATNVRAQYVYKESNVPILLEYRRGFVESTLFTIIEEKKYYVKSYSNNPLSELVRQIPKGAIISISHPVSLEVNGTMYETMIVESLYDRKQKTDDVSEWDVLTKLECTFRKQIYATEFHEDIYDAFDELLELLTKQDEIVLHLCLFCKYLDFHANYLFCLRDLPSEALNEIRTLGKRAGQDNWYRGGVWGIDEFHVCDNFEK